jgi:hypothetical protein
MYVVFGSMATALAKFTVCQPEAVSLENVAEASRVPLLDQRWPVWVPVLPEPL